MAQRQPRKLEEKALLEYALRSLGARAHSIAELRDKLRRRAERVADVEAVLGRLKRSGYLDDPKFASAFAASRLDNHGFGRLRVLRDLRQRRVAPAVAEKAVKDAFRNTDETSLIEAFLRRKFRGVPLDEHLAEPRNLASAYRKLRLAGFSSANTIRVLRRFASQAEGLEEMESEDGSS